MSSRRCVGLLAAGLFCLVLGIFLGGQLVAAGHVILLIGLFAAFLNRAGIGVNWKLMPASGWWLVGFVLASAISIVANWTIIESHLGHFKRLRYPLISLALLVTSVLATAVVREKWRRDVLVIAWLSSMALAILVGFITWRTGVHPFRYIDPIYTTRLSGLLGHTMTFAYTLQFSVVALAGFVLMPGVWKKVTRIPWPVAVSALLLAGGAMYLTYTRGAMLGVTAGFVTLAMMRSFKLLVAIAAIGVIAGTYAYFESSRYFQFEDPVRLNQWSAAALSWVEHPVFGLGFRNFEIYSVELKERFGFEKDTVDASGEPVFFKGHAHNNYLEAFASTGVLGGIAFLGFCFCWLREAWRSEHAAIFVPLIAAFLVSGFFENTFFDSEVLNCILLIYLFSQIVFNREAERAGDHSSSSVSSPSAGTITTET
ncbi:MAG: O-antigen ligase family protein [Verrucomicrobiales bacterium]